MENVCFRAFQLVNLVRCLKILQTYRAFYFLCLQLIELMGFQLVNLNLNVILYFGFSFSIKFAIHIIRFEMHIRNNVIIISMAIKIGIISKM